MEELNKIGKYSRFRSPLYYVYSLILTLATILALLLAGSLYFDSVLSKHYDRLINYHYYTSKQISETASALNQLKYLLLLERQDSVSEVPNLQNEKYIQSDVIRRAIHETVQQQKDGLSVLSPLTEKLDRQYSNLDSALSSNSPLSRPTSLIEALTITANQIYLLHQNESIRLISEIDQKTKLFNKFIWTVMIVGVTFGLPLTILILIKVTQQLRLNKSYTRQLEVDKLNLIRLSSVASQTTNSVIITDLEGKITWVNEGFSRLTGYTLKEVHGLKPGAILQGPETDQSTVALMHTALENLKEFNVDVINYHKDNNLYWVRITCNPLLGENGKAQGYIAVQSDVTNEKRTEKLTSERSERTALQRNLIAELSIDDSIVHCSLDEQLTKIIIKLCKNMQADLVSVWRLAEDNKQLERQILYDASNGIDPQKFVLDESDFPTYFAALKKESQIDAEDAHNDPRTRDMALEYLDLMRIRSLIDTAIRQDGHVIGVLCVEQRDSIRQWHADEKTFLSAIANLIAQLFANSERKTAQAKLKGTVAIQTATLNTIVDGVVATDQDGIIKMTNPSLNRMFGYSNDELYGKNINDLMPDVYVKPHDKYMFADKSHETSFTITGSTQNLTAMRNDGHIFPVEIAVQETSYLDEALYVASIKDVSELKEQQSKIEALAYYDSLTGLPNRRLLEDRIQMLNLKKHNSLHGHAFIFIDIDDFKHINDALGHHAGDILLIDAGKRISACLLTESDMVSRLGGDEFCIVLSQLESFEQAALDQAKQVAERIIHELKQPFFIENNRLTVSASIGISVECSEKVDLHVQMKRSDMAMYEAKKGGKNQVCLFNAQMESELLWRLKIQADLAVAIEQEALTVHYQPIVDDSGCIVKLEALVRWQHPTEGWIGPDLFIPIAEATHLIMPLGSQVLRTVLKDLGNWLKTAPNIKWAVAVNISQFQLAYPNFQNEVEQILSNFRFASGRLIFEVTESALADDIELSINKMQALTNHGITFSLDDFGTGYSSLEYLKRLPISELKIDRSFVNTIPADLKDVAIIKSVRSLAREMGLKVTAEGIENREQFQFLKNLNCDHYQGYYFSKPRTAPDIEKLLGADTLP